ncbi:hypothetical protein J7F03_28405 [Streptomyces sp. ISL-43]|uniref:hypothetical protein n=1 Tax=Streptomyces sp. ISL-43 TaxID=2819183 RepID=UPI001BE93B16|nr:hypothetical protein [Streptomyces sp. ISL-43]MBT2450927.1 hypothetical protein [Streptomyces sp. ISL-43]
MEIKHDGTPYTAAVVCSTTDNPNGAWTLHIVDTDGTMSDVLISWPVTAAPLPLLSRYDALALIGFASIQGGVEAWQWNERGGADGGSYWVGTTAVRPLTDDERAHGAEAARITLRS